MKRLLVAATLGWALVVLAKPPAGPPVSVTVTSEHLVEASPLKKVATGVTGQVEITADGRQLVFVDPDGLKVLPLAGGKARTLASRAVSFRLTPDSRAVVVRGEPFTRLALEGKAAPVTLAPGQTAHTISGQALSSTWFSFVNEAGQLLSAGLDGSAALPFELPPPKDHCCHAGAGDPKGFSANGEWLLYQYGASYEVVRADGSRRTPLDLSDAQLAGDLVVGTARDSQGASLVVIELATGKRTRITNTRLFAQARVVGDSVLQVDAQGRLIRADLKKASSAVVFDASPSGAVSPWLASDVHQTPRRQRRRARRAGDGPTPTPRAARRQRLVRRREGQREDHRGLRVGHERAERRGSAAGHRPRDQRGATAGGEAQVHRQSGRRARGGRGQCGA
jgi:hypothetical protein